VLLDFTGKVVVVTGAASGIGLAISRRFLDSGATLWMVDIDAGALESACAELAQAATAPHSRLCDVRNPDEVDAVVASDLAEHGALDVMVRLHRGNR
jgi:NAD(P)-dependent dehydrogenase (short-subunit alcohol dehydrogenase family)